MAPVKPSRTESLPIRSPPDSSASWRAIQRATDRLPTTAGETYIGDLKGEPKATLLLLPTKTNLEENETVSYLCMERRARSASTWLHMGSYGRSESLCHRCAACRLPPYPIEEAPETILDVTDLIFIDPVGTGFFPTIKTMGQGFLGP